VLTVLLRDWRRWVLCRPFVPLLGRVNTSGRRFRCVRRSIPIRLDLLVWIIRLGAHGGTNADQRSLFGILFGDACSKTGIVAR
jgi:hypothetical protein